MKRPRGSALEEVQRWVGFALKRGDQEFGINLDGGWAGFRQLASALANDRRDFRNVTSEKLKMLLQEDHSGRWEMKDDMVRKVPRSERGQLMCEKPAVSRRPWAIVKPVLRPQQPSMPPPPHLVRRPQQPATIPPGHSWRSFRIVAVDDEKAKQVVKMELDAQYLDYMTEGKKCTFLKRSGVSGRSQGVDGH